MIRSTYRHLNTVQKGSFGEAFAKMAFTVEGFSVYSTEYDDRGVDFVIQNPSSEYFAVQVKTTDNTANPFIKSDKFMKNDNFIFCVVRLNEGELPILYIARGIEWDSNYGCLNFNPRGGNAGAYYEMRFADKYKDELVLFEFSNYIETIRS